MRHAKTATLGLLAMGALLAAGPAATRPAAGAAERTVTISLPGGPVLQAGSDAGPDPDAASLLGQLTGGAGLGNSSAVLTEAVERLPSNGLGGTPPTLQLGFSNKFLADGRVDLRLTVRPAHDGQSGDADRLAAAAADVVRDRVLHTWDETVHMYNERLPKVQQEVADASTQLAKARQRVADGETKLRQRTGRIDLSAAGMQSAIDALELERQKVELDVAGLKARREGLQMAIAEQAQKARDAQKDDPAVHALQAAVDASKLRLDRIRTMVRQNAAAEAEVNEAELAVVQAEAQLAERRNTVGGTAEALAQWNRALTDAAIEQREKEARLSAATSRLAALADATAQQQELADAQHAQAAAAQKLTTAERRLHDVTAWLDRYGDARPTVTVRRATPTTAPAGE